MDTNILIVSIPKRSKYRPIFDGLLNGDYELVISNEILNEYVEILEMKANEIVANNIAEALLNLRNVIQKEAHFKWRLIEKDYDDNKYVDCAVIGNVDYLVTNDRHFNVLKDIPFPPLVVKSCEEFLAILEEKKKKSM